LYAPTAPTDLSARRAALLLTVLLHAALLAALLHYWPERHRVLAKAPSVFTFILPPDAAQPLIPPRPLPVAPAPRPRTETPRRAEPPPSIANAAPAPAAIFLPAGNAAEATPPATEAPPAAVAVSAPAPAQAITPPTFNAAYLDNPAPSYPPIARRNGEQGRVLLRVHVTPAGMPDAVEVRTSSGSPRLDNAALETVRRWRFVPARQGDETVAAWVLVPISFTLAT
jgi:protein TonB